MAMFDSVHAQAHDKKQLDTPMSGIAAFMHVGRLPTPYPHPRHSAHPRSPPHPRPLHPLHHSAYRS